MPRLDASALRAATSLRLVAASKGGQGKERKRDNERDKRRTEILVGEAGIVWYDEGKRESRSVALAGGEDEGRRLR